MPQKGCNKRGCLQTQTNDRNVLLSQREIPLVQALSNQFPVYQQGELGKSKWGLKATLRNSRTIVYNCALLWPFWALSKGNFRHKMSTIVGNRGQLWTRTLSPHLQNPLLDFPERSGGKRALFCRACVFRLFAGLASPDSNPYPNRSRIA